MRTELKILTTLALLGIIYLVMCLVETVRHGETPWCPVCHRWMKTAGIHGNTMSITKPSIKAEQWSYCTHCSILKHRPKFLIRRWLVDDGGFRYE